ncbi:hypothetical protein FNF27_02788 [Cafeteria roenbergensis]|uniref:Uncharacterized protein n=1 Tax=Cafeteria roenbergensis TaxID=33653 RepID=A0A5A8EEQ1_CAFRO|nr:hypothetical protein FNF27_02788 [Cafeteria roenbergensis]
MTPCSAAVAPKRAPRTAEPQRPGGLLAPHSLGCVTRYTMQESSQVALSSYIGMCSASAQTSSKSWLPSWPQPCPR